MKMFHNALNLTISSMALGIGGFIFLLSSLIKKKMIINNIVYWPYYTHFWNFLAPLDCIFLGAVTFLEVLTPNSCLSVPLVL